MIRFRFSRRARADLREIGDYIARDNPVRSLSFVDEIEARCRLLIEYPLKGAPRPDLHPLLRQVPFRSYIILYVATDELIEIKRVVHAARDLRRVI